MFEDFILEIQSDEVAAVFVSWFCEEENELWKEEFDDN